jgi:hypothetical protein
VVAVGEVTVEVLEQRLILIGDESVGLRFLLDLSTMAGSTSRTATKRKNKGDTRDKTRKYRSVGEIIK